LNAIRWTLLRVLHCCNAAVCAAQSLLTQVDRNQMTNNALHVRLRYLRNAEAFLALALPGVLAFHWWGSGETVDWALRLPPAVLVGLMLLQGAHYWHLKLVSMRSREPLPAYFRPLYHSFRAADLIALIVMTIWLAVMALRGATADCGERPWQRTWAVSRGEPEEPVETRIASCVFKKEL
jgi:hypothetical protein